KLSGFDWSVMTREMLQAVSYNLVGSLDCFPPGSDGQIIRFTHRGILDIVDAFADQEPQHPFGKDIIESICQRQLNAAISKDGFFTNVTPAMLQKAEAEELKDIDAEQKGPLTIAI